MLKPLLILLSAGLAVGCAGAPEGQAEEAGQDQPQARERSCYQAGWWAETAAVIYRRFGEDDMPKPALKEGEPLSAMPSMDECP
ncbi:hypothetical protein D3879_03855 [Pseudomonas cavernicola]|uniref:Lipoprotein n=1 Tax=Pseudomonas cavernicola TaxID=2320866 RepID=A0A418XJ29_9PSED|nr:hypothetical protein [Pseudomonas cavernicola]RJG12435.1 hypothetical protein D3879_03855 [Pseudomonas cavernicola]